MGSKQTTTVDMRALSLEEVIALQNQGGEIYQKVIKNTFPGRDFTEIRERFIKRRPVDREKSEKLSHEYMGMIQKCLDEQDERILELQKILNKSCNRLVDAQNKFNAAKKKLERAQQIYEDAKSDFEQADQKRQKVSDEYIAEEKKLDDSKIFVLIHPSATLKQLQFNKVGIFVTTKLDKHKLEKAGCVDMVFDNDEEENFVENIPYYMLNELPESELKGYVAYTNMVINFYLNEKDFVAIFSSKEISELLASNGYDISEA